MRGCSICDGERSARPELSGPDRSGVATGTFGVHVCEACGTGFTTPGVEEKDLAMYYDDSYGPHAASSAMALFARLVNTLRLKTRLFRTMGPGEGSTVLDVGSGRGDILAGLAGQGWRVTGLEPSPEAARHANSSGVPTVAGTLTTAMEGGQLEEESFDVVLFHHSLEHVEDPVSDLERACRLLRPGGRVLIAVPNFGSRAAREMGGAWWALDLPRHRTHFTRTGLSRAIVRAGLEPRLVAARASVLGPAANAWQRRTGRFKPSGPPFLASYAASAAAYPLYWARNAVRGNGEFLAAIARKP